MTHTLKYQIPLYNPITALKEILSSDNEDVPIVAKFISSRALICCRHRKCIKMIDAGLMAPPEHVICVEDEIIECHPPIGKINTLKVSQLYDITLAYILYDSHLMTALGCLLLTVIILYSNDYLLFCGDIDRLSILLNIDKQLIPAELNKLIQEGWLEPSNTGFTIKIPLDHKNFISGIILDNLEEF